MLVNAEKVGLCHQMGCLPNIATRSVVISCKISCDMKATTCVEVIEKGFDYTDILRRGSSVGRATDSRSKDPKDHRFEPRLRQEHKKNLWEFF